MKKIKISLLSLTLLFAFVSCGQEESLQEQETKVVAETLSDEALIGKFERYNEQHQYGGWYCPDNFGFKPVDIQELSQVEVIADRLPSKEEAQSGKSLIHVDSAKYPNAFALEMDLPRLGRIYSPYKGFSELVIVIQAVVIDEDTIVGYRFPAGGNGSAWLGQVEIFSDDQVNAMGSQPMIYKKTQMNTSQEGVWEAFTKTTYAKELGEKFNEKEFFSAEWTTESFKRLTIDMPGIKAKGYIANHYGCIYLQIDYNVNGQHSVEKMLICEQEDGSSDLHFAAGPILSDYEAEEKKWSGVLNTMVSSGW